ncbi:MAG: AtpZ/AtpI family protein [Pseudomonadota bacterium]
MSDPTDGTKLRQLENKLEEMKKRDAPRKSHQEEHYSQAQVAWRMVIELVAGLGIGFGMGFGLDALIGTRPWLMILFTLLGFVAGVQTMMRTAQEVQNKRKAAEAAKLDDAPTAGSSE